MNIREWAVNHCLRKGMPQISAEAVVEIAEITNERMKGRWADTLDGYSESAFDRLSLFLDEAALGWIEENRLQAWYKPMFEGTVRGL